MLFKCILTFAGKRNCRGGCKRKEKAFIIRQPSVGYVNVVESGTITLKSLNEIKFTAEFSFYLENTIMNNFS